MKIYLSGGYLTDKHINYCWSYFYIINTNMRYGALADLKRFIDIMRRVKDEDK